MVVQQVLLAICLGICWLYDIALQYTSDIFVRSRFLLLAQFDVLLFGARKAPNRDLLLVCAWIGEMTVECLPRTYLLSPASIPQG